MTTLARITVAIIISLFFSSCAFDVNFGNGTAGNGEVIHDTRTINEEFTEIHASEGIDVYVTQADEFSIEVEGDENIIDLIGTDIKNGRLRIHAIENIGRATKKVYVSLPIIDKLDSSSGADLITRNVIEADRISLKASSGADLYIEVKADEITADASSGADIKIEGEANMLYADASSGADIKARDLNTKICDADVSSGADITVNVSESLTADASSGGDIKYSGDANVQAKKSASGSVHKY